MKSELQILLAKACQPLPVYTDVIEEKTGPAHNPMHVVEVTCDSVLFKGRAFRGTASKKKDTQKAAAAAALAFIQDGHGGGGGGDRVNTTLVDDYVGVGCVDVGVGASASDTTPSLTVVSPAAKNILQEHFQRLGCALPVYRTISDGSLPHTREVMLHDGSTYTGTGYRVKEADLVAATNALHHLGRVTTPTLPRVLSNDATPTLVCVDAENKPGVQEWCEVAMGDNIEIRTYAAHNHQRATAKHAVAVASARVDAADIKVIMDATAWAHLHRYGGVVCKVVIVTGDHFARTLAELLRSECPMCRVMVATSVGGGGAGIVVCCCVV